MKNLLTLSVNLSLAVVAAASGEAWPHLPYSTMNYRGAEIIRFTPKLWGAKSQLFPILLSERVQQFIFDDNVGAYVVTMDHVLPADWSAPKYAFGTRQKDVLVFVYFRRDVAVDVVNTAARKILIRRSFAQINQGKGPLDYEGDDFDWCGQPYPDPRNGKMLLPGGRLMSDDPRKPETYGPSFAVNLTTCEITQIPSK